MSPKVTLMVSMMLMIKGVVAKQAKVDIKKKHGWCLTLSACKVSDVKALP